MAAVGRSRCGNVLPGNGRLRDFHLQLYVHPVPGALRFRLLLGRFLDAISGTSVAPALAEGPQSGTRPADITRAFSFNLSSAVLHARPAAQRASTTAWRPYNSSATAETAGCGSSPDTARSDRSNIHRPTAIPIARRVEAETERARQVPVGRHERPGVIPRVPIPSRAIPPWIR